MFVVDRNPFRENNVLEEEDYLEPSEEDEMLTEIRPRNAWIDSDDENVQINLEMVPRLRKLRKETDLKTRFVVGGSEYENRLREQYEKLHPRPFWADQSNFTDTVQSEDDVACLFAFQPAPKKKSVGGSRVGGNDSHSMNFVGRIHGSVSNSLSKKVSVSLGWHPFGTHILSAGPDKRIRIFALPKEEEGHGFAAPLIHSIAFKGSGASPITIQSALWTENEILVSGKKPYYYSIDTVSFVPTKISLLGAGVDPRCSTDVPSSLPNMTQGLDYLAFAGPGGYSYLIHKKTKHCVARLKAGVDSRIKGLGFSPDDSILWVLESGSVGSDITAWDIRTSKCISRKNCMGGGVFGTKLSVSPDGTTIAVSGNQGVVSFYSTSSLLSTEKTQVSSELDQITTFIDALDWSDYDPSLIAFASGDKRDAVRISVVEKGDAKVVPGWPAGSSHLGKISNLKWSPISSHLALSTSQCKIKLFKYK